MSYYLLPNNNNTIIVNPYASDVSSNEPIISYSLYNYYKDLYKYAYNMTNNNDKSNNDISLNSYEEVVKNVNPYEYLFSKIPGTNLSISKLETKSNLFYDLLEICNIFNLSEYFYKKKIFSLHVSKNYSDSIKMFEVLRHDFNDENIYFEEAEEFNISKSINNIKFDSLFFETKNDTIENYIKSFMEAIIIILRHITSGGISIIKINEVFHKPIIDIIYFLSSLFEKVYLIKPNTSNITTFDKYIICINFLFDESNLNIFKLNYYKLFIFLKKNEKKHIISVLDDEIPYYFITKLLEINNIMGQQQLETLDQIVGILKNKNKEEKLEVLKKINIQKCIKWCEKYAMPHNKNTEKANIFLPINKEDDIIDDLIC
jgi:hypothetical protein